MRNDTRPPAARQLLLTTLGAFCLVSACTHPRVTTYMPSDGRLSCAELATEIREAEEAIALIDKKTGVSWRNAGLLVVSGIGLIMNEVNGSRERTAATARIDHLRQLQQQQQCD